MYTVVEYVRNLFLGDPYESQIFCFLKQKSNLAFLWRNSPLFVHNVFFCKCSQHGSTKHWIKSVGGRFIKCRKNQSFDSRKTNPTSCKLTPGLKATMVHARTDTHSSCKQQNLSETASYCIGTVEERCGQVTSHYQCRPKYADSQWVFLFNRKIYPNRWICLIMLGLFKHTQLLVVSTPYNSLIHSQRIFLHTHRLVK